MLYLDHLENVAKEAMRSHQTRGLGCLQCLCGDRNSVDLLMPSSEHSMRCLTVSTTNLHNVIET